MLVLLAGSSAPHFVLAADEPWNAGPPEQGCPLESQVLVVFDGYTDAKVQLRLDGAVLHVLADSEIDTSLGGDGISVDGGELVPFSRTDGLMGMLIDRNLEQLLESFRRGSRAEVRLNFWPGWPVTGVKTATFSLKGFTRASVQQTACREQAGGA
ncbi:MAG: hypothetical protein KDH88_10605 [Chromatiales bacterium]|nr:hypothetical protein [Chromatiales bacterium]